MNVSQELPPMARTEPGVCGAGEGWEWRGRPKLREPAWGRGDREVCELKTSL